MADKKIHQLKKQEVVDKMRELGVDVDPELTAPELKSVLRDHLKGRKPHPDLVNISRMTRPELLELAQKYNIQALKSHTKPCVTRMIRDAVRHRSTPHPEDLMKFGAHYSRKYREVETCVEYCDWVMACYQASPVHSGDPSLSPKSHGADDSGDPLYECRELERFASYLLARGYVPGKSPRCHATSASTAATSEPHVTIQAPTTDLPEDHASHSDVVTAMSALITDVNRLSDELARLYAADGWTVVNAASEPDPTS